MALSILSGLVAVTVVAMILNRDGFRPFTAVFWVGYAAVELIGSGAIL